MKAELKNLFNLVDQYEFPPHGRRIISAARRAVENRYSVKVTGRRN